MTTCVNPACPCGGCAYRECCEPLHDGHREALTAEELMRARYSAYAKRHFDYVFRTWHPRTRPRVVDAGSMSWHGLKIIDRVAGGEADDFGTVEFIASYREGGHGGAMRERSRFVRRAGRWFYLDGEG